MTGQWRYVTSRDMLQAQRDMVKVERAMQTWDEQMAERAARQRGEALKSIKWDH